MPAQHHLGRGAAVLGGDGQQGGLGQQVLALAQRAPRLGGDAVLGVQGAQLGLREVGVQLDLVERRLHLGLLEQQLQVRHPEVRDADRADPALGVQLLEGAPDVQEGVAVHRARPVDQVQVQPVEAEAAERLVEGAQHPAAALLAGPVDGAGVPQLGGHEQLVAGHAGLGDRLAGARLVLVDRGGVDRAVAGLQRGAHRRDGLFVRHLPDAEAELRDSHAVVQCDRGDRGDRPGRGGRGGRGYCGGAGHGRSALRLRLASASLLPERWQRR